MKPKFSVDQTVQELGNGLAVRITAPVAKAAGLTRGVPIKVEVIDGGVFVHVVSEPELTLAQMLEAFDPAIHGGEAMMTGRAGAEIF